MRDYQRMQRLAEPEKMLWNRAKERAVWANLPFNITRSMIVIPSHCPALGIELTIGGKRSKHSPSLDRVNPTSGYVEGNIRVISDHANRLKGDRFLPDLIYLARYGVEERRSDYERIAAYVERELLLASAREHADRQGEHCDDWQAVTALLDQICNYGLAGFTSARLAS